MALTNKQIIFFEQQVSVLLKNKQNNPRTLTQHSSLDSRKYHFKWSRLNLSLEAEQIKLASKVAEFKNISVIKLVHFDEKRNVLITEHIEGDSCFNPLWNDHSWRRFCKPQSMPWDERLIELTQWFSNYHDLTINKNEDLVDTCKDSLKALINMKLEKIKASSSSPFTDKQHEIIVKYVNKHFESASWIGLPIGNIHADITLVNILIDKKKCLHIIDFGDSRLGFLLEDFVQLWSCIWEVSMCSRGQGLNSILPLMLDTFNAQSNNTPKVNINSPEFRILRLYKAVNRISESSQYFYNNNLVPLSTRILHKKLTKQHFKYILDLINE